MIAAARCMPGVCGVLVSSASPGITRTPSVRQSRVMALTLARRQPFAGGGVGREERLHGQLGQRDVVRAAEGRQRRVEGEVAVRVGEGDGEQQLLRGAGRVGCRARRRRRGSRGPLAAARPAAGSPLQRSARSRRWPRWAIHPAGSRTRGRRPPGCSPMR